MENDNSILIQILIALTGAFIWEIVLRNWVQKLFLFIKKKYVWKKIFSFRGEYSIAKSTVPGPKILTRESDNIIEREIISKLGKQNYSEDFPQNFDMNHPNLNLIILGSTRYNLHAEAVQKYFSTNFEYIYDSYETDPGQKLLKLIGEHNVEYISSADLKDGKTRKGIDYGMLFIGKLPHSKKVIWISGIHGAGTIGVFKYLDKQADKISKSLPNEIMQGTSWLFRIKYKKNARESFDMIDDVELIGESRICTPREVSAKPKVLICDLGNVVMLFDRFRTYRSIGHRLGIHYTKVAARIESTDIRQRYERGEMSDENFHEEILSMFKTSKDKLPFDLFSEFWGDIFWPNRNMISALKYLKSQVKLMLLSNTNNLHFSNINEHYNDVILMFENRIVLSYKENMSKPGKKIFDRAIKALEKDDITYSDCIYVDDKIENVDIAVKLGMNGIIYYSYPQFVYSVRKLGLYIP